MLRLIPWQKKKYIETFCNHTPIDKMFFFFVILEITCFYSLSNFNLKKSLELFTLDV